MLAYLIGTLLFIVAGTFIYMKRKGISLKTPSDRTSFPLKTTPFFICPAGQDDIEIIRHLALEIWPKAYSETLSPQQVIYMLNKMYSVASLQKQMNEGHQFSIISNNNNPIGFASYSEIKPFVYKLHKIYILPAFQGLGAGKFSIGSIIDEIISKGASSLLLNVNKHNPAKAFYEHLGFKIASTENTDIGNGYFLNDYVMELKFQKTEALPASKPMFLAERAGEN